MNLEDRIASGAFTLIAEIGVNYYDIARQRGISPIDYCGPIATAFHA